MKQFLYLDTDIVNSIIAQSEKGIITGFSTEEENGEQKSTNKSISGNLEGDAGGKLLKVFNAELKLDIRGGIGTEKEVHSASREIITKILHDAAFDIAYDSITPVCLTSNGQDQDDYGAYVELTRVFDVVDFDYLERIFSKGGLIEYLVQSFNRFLIISLDVLICRYSPLFRAFPALFISEEPHKSFYYPSCFRSQK